ncbi:MAG: polyprenyl synthetase family protein [Candidatus Kapabacteria bacterium]|nr:polyprenyl synthetase family protein [Candidatus Kapabacteria bacterium]
MNLKEISRPIESDLKNFNAYFDLILKSDMKLLDLLIKQVKQAKGKQMRPMLVLLTAQLCGKIDERVYLAASAIELWHTATLIHDDVVDEADERRGLASINAIWDNKIAVLLGDFLLAKGLLALVNNAEFDFLRVASYAIKLMSEGELLQIQKSRETDISEETYFEIINGKTASLLSVCCEIGAIAAGADDATSKKMQEFGKNLGNAFQIKDDIMDYVGSNTIIGKATGNDLKEKKITLPLIYALQNTDPKTSKTIISKVKGKQLSDKDVREIIQFVIDRGGIEKSHHKAEEFIAKSIAIISEFEPSPARTALEHFSKFVLERKK